MMIYGNTGYTLHATTVDGKMSLCVVVSFAFALLCFVSCLTGGSWGSRSHLMRL